MRRTAAALVSVLLGSGVAMGACSPDKKGFGQSCATAADCDPATPLCLEVSTTVYDECAGQRTVRVCTSRCAKLDDCKDLSSTVWQTPECRFDCATKAALVASAKLNPGHTKPPPSGMCFWGGPP